MYNIVDESGKQASKVEVTSSLRVVRYLSDRGPVKRPSIFSLYLFGTKCVVGRIIRYGGERNRQGQGKLCCVPRLSVGLVKQLAKALNGKAQFQMAA